MESPCGDSTLITSAPRSARWVVMAPGPSIELSTMRTPARGGRGIRRSYGGRSHSAKTARYPCRAMHVEVGPVAAASAAAWITYARTLIAGGRIKGRRVDAGIPGEVAESSARIFDTR